MSEIRLKGLAGIDMADIPVGGGVPLDAAWTSVGVTYRDEASLTEEDPTVTEHFSNENDDPEESDMASGKRTLAFTLIDFTPATLVKFVGGETSGTGDTLAWNAPAQKAKIEKAFRLRSKNGHYITLPRVSFTSKLDYNLAPSGIAKVLITGTVMSPGDTDVSSIIKGITPVED
jgi:hypothetical protein